MRHLAASSTSTRAAALLCAAALLPLTACASSDEDLAARAKGLGSVTQVELSESNDGGRTLEVTVEANSSVAAVRNVFRTMKDEVSDDDTVVVTLNSPAPAEIFSQEGRVPDEATVETLLKTPEDLSVQSFRITLGARTKVNVGLTHTPFSTVVERGDELAAGDAFDDVEVRSGKRSYAIGARTDENLLKARAALVSEVDSDFELLAVDVTGTGPLELIVSPVSLQAVKVFLAEEADNRHGVVTVNA